MNYGYVYVLSNPAIPGALKIGHSMLDPRVRAQQLYTTGVPMPFDIEFVFYTADPEQIEAQVHRHFARDRHNVGREFFWLPAELVIKFLINECSDYQVKAIDESAHDVLTRLYEAAMDEGISQNEACEAMSYINPDAIVDAVATFRMVKQIHATPFDPNKEPVPHGGFE